MFVLFFSFANSLTLVLFLQLDHLYKGGFAPLAKIRDHQKVLNEVVVLKQQLKIAEAKLLESSKTHSFIFIQNANLSKDVSARLARLLASRGAREPCRLNMMLPWLLNLMLRLRL